MGRKEIVVSNTTPLINFGSIDSLHILHRLFGIVTIPPAVHRESITQAKRREVGTRLQNAGWIQVIDVNNRSLIDSFSAQLNSGEAEGIALAIELHAGLVLLDDLAAREVALHFNLNFIGTIGCLSLAKQQKIITRVKPYLDKMKNEAGYWISDELYQRVLKNQGER